MFTSRLYAGDIIGEYTRIIQFAQIKTIQKPEVIDVV